MSRFDFILKHVLKTKIEKANELSRRLDWKIEVEKDKVGNEELLVARNNKEYEEVYRWMWYVPEDEKLYRSTSGKTNGEWGVWETVDIFNDRFYHKVAIAILVVYDRLSKMIYFITMIEGTSVEGLV